MNDYRTRRLARAGRLREWADKRAQKAEASYKASNALTEGMPLGQPILIGHHSEGAHRRRIARVDSHMSSVVENSNKAEEMRQKADNIEAADARAIFSDDEDAIARLDERISEATAKRVVMTAFNKTARKGTPDYDLLTDELTNSYVDYYVYSSIKKGEPFPSFAMSNLGANTRRLQKRLDGLKREQSAKNAHCLTGAQS
ncbi:DUF3560 domain-containing protein [Cryobacterium sp. TMT2-15-1]|uniref:DUF3560 domain-containing protein n=1 Tax=Cryobacterium sp. TMT2-15-1 TaxID=1259246 RepID=UPI00106AD25F|nr:DUF3560 domain-containing protein [Cryobacterium sp. TMT2-15-1]TFC63736.1 DUF3560 domain-containing protein [Cryobacterium sp. TMT2-15-1]